MPLIASDSGGADFAPVPAGVHIAVCNLVADMGDVLNKISGKPQHKVFIRWEIPALRIQWDDRSTQTHHEGPQMIGSRYTLSLSSKSLLYRDLTNWRGRPFTADELKAFDLFKVLGAACQLQITHNPDARTGKVYANITGVFGLPPNFQRPRAETPLIKYSKDEPQMFNQLPAWLQQFIKLQQQAAATPAFDQGGYDAFSNNDPRSPAYVEQNPNRPRVTTFTPPPRDPFDDELPPLDSYESNGSEGALEEDDDGIPF